MLSVVIPIHNEEPSILPLYDRLTSVLEKLRRPYEIIFVDDASSDRSFVLLANLVETDHRLKVVRLRRNFGQTAALAAGFDEAQGSVIISLDGDLQHAPEDIPALLGKIDEGYDIASGWRRNRLDNAVTRKIPSRIANWLMARASKVNLRDFGTTFKAYRAEVLRDVNLYGELHRFIPALAAFYGARVAEVEIRNQPRASGGSHYGLSRTFRVFFDLITIRFLLKYMYRPLHLFGSVGAISLVSGLGVAFWLMLSKLLWRVNVADVHGPLLVFAAVLILFGGQMLALGLLGDLQVRNFQEPARRVPYTVAHVLRSQGHEHQAVNES